MVRSATRTAAPAEMADESRGSVLAALAANTTIAVAKGTAAVLTGSPALFAETLHTVADAGNEVFLYIAIRRSRHPPNASLRAAQVDGPALLDATEAPDPVFVTASDNPEIPQALERLAPRLHRLELLRTGAMPGRRALAQHEAIIARSANGDARGAASAVRENWLELGAMIERSLAPAFSA